MLGTQVPTCFITLLASIGWYLVEVEMAFRDTMTFQKQKFPILSGDVTFDLLWLLYKPMPFPQIFIQSRISFFSTAIIKHHNQGNL